jgi:plasmid stabilization system protein ParE
MRRKINWDKQSVKYFREAIRYIQKDSPQNADKIKNEILKRISELAETPEICTSDKYKLNNNGQYKAFELYHFRISYLVKDNEIIIARMRSTHQKPLDY